MQATTVSASHKKDTPRYRVYQVDEDQGIVGSLYVPLDVEEGEESDLPTSVAIRVAQPATKASTSK